MYLHWRTALESDVRGCSLLLVMSGAELLEAVTELIDSFRESADDHSEEVFLEEASRGERQAVLLGQKFPAELDVVVDVGELVTLDAHHHVHRSAASDRCHTSDRAEAAECSLRRGR